MPTRMNLKILPEILKSRRYQTALVVLMFLPLLFLNNMSSHDWGDDFAQYIHQAENMVKGIPQSETGFVYSQENYIGPRAYPSGFPILLAPVYALFGNRMLAFTTFLSVICFFLAFAVLAFYRRHFSSTAALVLTFILIYNPQLVLFKQEVMSDLPFTLFLILALLMYRGLKPGNYRKIFLFGLLAGFIIMIRSAGIVLIAAIIADQFLEWYRRKRQARREGRSYRQDARLWVFQGMLVLVPLLVYFVFNSLIFRIPSAGSLNDYLVFYYSGNFLKTIPPNLEKYVEVFRFMNIPAIGEFRFAALITGSVFLSMALFGFVKKLFTTLGIEDLFFIIYLFILLVFPNNYSAFRLLIPVWFLLLYYAALGFRSLRISYVKTGRRRVLILGMILFLMYLPGLVMVSSSRFSIQDGPQEARTTQAFRYIENNVADTSVIVFFKPRALALYTGKQGFADPFTQDPTEIYVQLLENGADYILIHNKYTGEAMKRHVRMLKSGAREVWKNKDYRLYRLLPPNPSEQY